MLTVSALRAPIGSSRRIASRTGRRSQGVIGRAAAVAAIAMPAVAFGQLSTTWTGSQSADWFNSGNWSAGVPDATIDAEVAGGLPQITAGDAAAHTLFLGALSGGGVLTHTGGTLRAGVIQVGSPASGGCVLSGTGEVDTVQTILKTGSFDQSAGTHNVDFLSFLGTATYRISGGDLNISSRLQYANAGSARFIQTGGTVNSPSGTLTFSNSGSSSYELQAGSLSIRLQNINGSFVQSGGTNTTTLMNLGTAGRYVLSAGTLSLGSYTSAGTIDLVLGPEPR
jgi:hypothetical protein